MSTKDLVFLLQTAVFGSIGFMAISWGREKAKTEAAMFAWLFLGVISLLIMVDGWVRFVINEEIDRREQQRLYQPLDPFDPNNGFYVVPEKAILLRREDDELA